MLDITIPMWVLLAVAGLPTLILLMLSFRLMRIKRYKNKVLSQGAQESFQQRIPQEGFNKQMDQMILEQQIDSVFGALATKLESERIKLKALIHHSHSGVSNTAFNESLYQQPAMKVDRANEMVSNTQPREAQSSVAGMVAEGLGSEEIARRLGLSQAEADLAMKIHSGRRGQRLEAVA